MTRTPSPHRVIDVDSHFVEPPNWMEQVDPDLARAVAAVAPTSIGEQVIGEVFESIPQEGRPWALGAGLAGLAGILVVPIIGLSVNQVGLLLVPALAAALVGGFCRSR